jgi:hypothetical protein
MNTTMVGLGHAMTIPQLLGSIPIGVVFCFAKIYVFISFLCFISFFPFFKYLFLEIGMHIIRILKTCSTLLAPERSKGYVARSHEFGDFAKKPSALFEIVKRPRKFIPHSNRVQMFCGQALDLKFISTKRSGNGRFTNTPATLLQKNHPTTLPPRLIPPEP